MHNTLIEKFPISVSHFPNGLSDSNLVTGFPVTIFNITNITAAYFDLLTHEEVDKKWLSFSPFTPDAVSVLVMGIPTIFM